jgi:hypothetical protein
MYNLKIADMTVIIAQSGAGAVQSTRIGILFSGSQKKRDLMAQLLRHTSIASGCMRIGAQSEIVPSACYMLHHIEAYIDKRTTSRNESSPTPRTHPRHHSSARNFTACGGSTITHTTSSSNRAIVIMDERAQMQQENMIAERSAQIDKPRHKLYTDCNARCSDETTTGNSFVIAVLVNHHAKSDVAIHHAKGCDERDSSHTEARVPRCHANNICGVVMTQPARVIPDALSNVLRVSEDMHTRCSDTNALHAIQQCQAPTS